MENNVYKMVTDRIVEMLNKGVIPWRKPWKGALADAEDCAISYTSRRAYSMLNQWLLVEPGEYLTFKQIHELGGSVVKGAKSRMVVFFTKASYVKKDEETGEEILCSYPLLKYYNVFHIKDTTGIESKCKPGEKVEIERGNEVADAMIAEYVQRVGLKFHDDKPSDRAYYTPVLDCVVVPMKSQYTEIAEYYSTTFHELTHSTMKADRCDRVAENAKSFFVNEEYSREELVAEMGAAMLCSVNGIDCEKAFKNSVAYIGGWIKSLRNDPKMIVWAASRAEKAAKFIANVQS